MTRYELLMSLHVLGASVWVGAAAIYLVLHQYLYSLAGRGEMFAVLRHTDRIAPFVFVPAILITLIFGVLMVVTEDALTFADTWVSLGFAALLISFVLGFVSGVPMAASFTKLKDRVGADAPEVGAAARRLLLIAYVEMALLVGAVFIMVWKPGA